MSKKLVSDYIANSRLEIRYFRDKRGVVYAEKVSIFGDLANLPAVSNSRQIVKMGGSFRLIKSAKAQAKIKALEQMICEQSEYWHDWRIDKAAMTHTPFYDQHSLILVEASESMNRQDTHNIAKCVGDLLQSVGAIKNDKNATIFCERKRLLHRDARDQTDILIFPALDVYEGFRSVWSGLASWFDGLDTSAEAHDRLVKELFGIK